MGRYEDFLFYAFMTVAIVFLTLAALGMAHDMIAKGVL